MIVADYCIPGTLKIEEKFVNWTQFVEKNIFDRFFLPGEPWIKLMEMDTVMHV